jgi:hypothetical protein
LEDDLYERAYVHTRLSDWRDQRSFLGANLALFLASGKVESESGTIVIGYANGDYVASGQYVGVTLDLGIAEGDHVAWAGRKSQ